jgi:hypothetical protein
MAHPSSTGAVASHPRHPPPRPQERGEWWELAESAKKAVAPEVREVSWVRLSVALASMSPDQPFVDEWQREELARCGAQREVPLVTREILQQLQSLGSVEAAKQTSIERTVEARNPPELARPSSPELARSRLTSSDLV